jgi:hypothetical protein
MRIEASILEAPPGRLRDEDGGDTRFRALMQAGDWESLPVAIRRRFSKRLTSGATVLYAGEVLETTMSRVGWLWAQPCDRSAAAALTRNRHVPAVVAVTESMQPRPDLDGLTDSPAALRRWCIRKRFAGPTGLEEYVGYGIGMTLTVEAREGAPIFAAGLFVELFGGAGGCRPARARHTDGRSCRACPRPLHHQPARRPHPSPARLHDPPDGDVP